MSYYIKRYPSSSKPPPPKRSEWYAKRLQDYRREYQSQRRMPLDQSIIQGLRMNAWRSQRPEDVPRGQWNPQEYVYDPTPGMLEQKKGFKMALAKGVTNIEERQKLYKTFDRYYDKLVDRARKLSMEYDELRRRSGGWATSDRNVRARTSPATVDLTTDTYDLTGDD